MLIKFVFRYLLFLVLVSLPFVLLVRGSVHLHEKYHFYPFVAVIGGFLFTCLLLFVYLIILGTPTRFIRERWKIAAFLLLAYCGYSQWYIAGKNVKSKEIAREYKHLHPVMRLGVRTILLIDKDLMMTDANRVPEDYRDMGLSVKEHSLHYQQKNGFVHAIDVRTHDRSAIRNFLLKSYFRTLGFNVLRHGGTGDHFHISLMSHDRPPAY